ncbi:MAG TPA: hypothetical protein VF622_20075, partial [Segetibacter sp.]
MNKGTISFLSAILTLASCEKDCRLQPISTNVFDLNAVPKTLYLESDIEIDSLVLVETLENFEKTSYKGLMSYRECEHFKSYEYNFRNERIFVSIRKNDKGTINLSLLGFGRCLNLDEIVVSEEELLSSK